MTNKQLENMGIIIADSPNKKHKFIRYWCNTTQYFIHIPHPIKKVTIEDVLLIIHKQSIELGKMYGRSEFIGDLRKLLELE